MEPMVSVVIPTYNRINWLQEAIASVLEQTYTNYEILVIDDGSTEKIEALEILKNDKIRYFKNSNHGVAYSRNFGIKNSIGKYIAFLDSDDIWMKDKLEIQVSFMEKNKALWSQHNYYYFEDGTNKILKSINTFKYNENPNRFLFTSFKVQTSCFMVERKRTIENNCWFDESKTFGEDNEFFYSLARIEKMSCIDKYLLKFRIRGTNTGKDMTKQLKSRAVIYKEHSADDLYLNNTDWLCKSAYSLCSFLSNQLEKINRDSILSKLYVIPWAMFKIDSKYYLLKSEGV